MAVTIVVEGVWMTVQGKDLPEYAYVAIAARRAQFDALLWQVPPLTMAAQAFLMTIALGSDTSQLARIMASTLSLIAALASLQLFASHRRSELVDAELLEEHELTRTPPIPVHGKSFRDKRKDLPSEDRYIRLLTKVRSYRVWMLALALFALGSAVVLVIALAAPDLLE